MTSLPDLSQLDPDEQLKRNALGMRASVIPQQATSSNGPVIAPPSVAQGVNLPPVGPQPNKLGQDESQLEQLKSSPRFMGSQSGIASLKPKSTIGKIGKGILGGLDVIGSTLAPGLTARIPGTSMHHALLENQAAGNVAEDVAQQEKQAKAKEENASAAEKENAEPGAAATVTTDKGIKQWDPKTNSYDIPVGGAPPKTGGVTHVATDQGIMLLHPDGSVTPLTVNGKPLMPPQKPAVESPKQGTVNGKPAWGVLDPQRGWVDPETHQPIQGFQPPPNYAQVAPSLVNQRNQTQTKQMLGPDGMVHDYGWDPDTQRFAIDMGLSGSGQQGSRASAAAAAHTAGDELINDLQANKDKLGTLSAWVKKYGLNTPIADPQLAQLQAELSSFAALQPAVHGFRSHNALETFDKIVGGIQQNPEATIAAIRGIQKTLGAVNPKVAQPGGGQQIPSFAEWKQSQGPQ